MSGRISVDDAALDGGARRLRSAQGGLAGLQGRLNDGLAGGAPPAVAGQVRGALAAARGAVVGVQGRLESRAGELNRRAAFVRIADGDIRRADLKLLTGVDLGGAAALPFKVAGASLGPVSVKDLAGGTEEALQRWATFWSTHSYQRKPNTGLTRRQALYQGKVRWLSYNRQLQNHAVAVGRLRRGANGIFWFSQLADTVEVFGADGAVKQNRAAGGVLGGLAAGQWVAPHVTRQGGRTLAAGAARLAATQLGGRMVATRTGAAVGAMLGGPIGAAVGAGIGFAAASVLGSSLGKKLGAELGKTGVGRAVGGAVDGIKGGAKKVWKKLF